MIYIIVLDDVYTTSSTIIVYIKESAAHTLLTSKYVLLLI